LRLHVRFLTGPRRGQRALFRHSPVRAGRSRDNDILIPDVDEPLSSGRHAEFVYEDSCWWVVDLDSTNGTRLNGTLIRRARLTGRDRVSLGDCEIEVQAGRARADWSIVGIVAAIGLVAALGWLLWRAPPVPLDSVESAARRSVYLVVIQEEDRRTPVGTAFAIEGGRLVTNAHVAAPLALLAADGPRAAFVVNADGPAPRRIRGVTLHPGWRAGSIADDVALLDVEGNAPTPLTLAGDDAIRALAPGDTVAIFGFPDPFAEPDRPHGSLTASVLQEVRGSRYLVVRMAVVPGASGSPVFTPNGRVIGMIAGSGGAGRAEVTGGEETSRGVAISAAVIRQAIE
jgi:V8-like Glu-specific endopeptidase